MTLPYNTCSELPDKLQFIKQKKDRAGKTRPVLQIINP